MSEQGTDELKAERELWEPLCSLHEHKGLNLPGLLHSFVSQAKEALLPWAADADFDELCGKGCSEVSLALALRCFTFARSVERVWRKVVPSARRRKQVVRTLDDAADVLQELQDSWNLAVLEQLKNPLPESLHQSDASDREILNIVSRMEPEWPVSAPAPPPATMIRALRLYARTLNLFCAISEDTQTHSSDSIPRYLISAYVKRATGEFNDPHVSALIGSTLDAGPYDETAHRMWLARNYKRLEKAHAFLVHALADIGALAGSSAEHLKQIPASGVMFVLLHPQRNRPHDGQAECGPKQIRVTG